MPRVVTASRTSASAGLHSFIIVNNPSYFIGNLPVNGIDYAFFDVITNGMTPVGTVVGLMRETAGVANQYSAARRFQLEIGQVPGYQHHQRQPDHMHRQLLRFRRPDGQIITNNENLTMTFYPATPGRNSRSASTAFDVEAFQLQLRLPEDLRRRQHPGALLGTWCGTDNPGIRYRNNTNGGR